MNQLSREAARARMNALGAAGVPFLFVIDFAMARPLLWESPLAAAPVTDAALPRFKLNALRNYEPPVVLEARPPLELVKHPVSYERYEQAFGHCLREINYGNSYLLNLTFPTRIEVNRSLRELFDESHARYKLHLPAQGVVCFSPETFVQIRDGVISSNPMKGTISADVPDAAARILADEKEMGEHHTIVDFIRNDLNRVAKRVRVTDFRYMDRIETHQGALLQVSSRISGELPPDYVKRIGDVLYTLLPGGSISGAPKRKTLEIIAAAEGYDRGYYTGVFGYFDGESLDSAVMIRYIEEQDGALYFKSGGGITSQSDAATEYQELLDKVYVPTRAAVHAGL